METPGKIILQARKKKHLSQEELAHQSGVSLRTIQRIERGKVNPHGHTLKELAKTLEISPADFEEKRESNFSRLRSLNAIGLLFIIIPAVHVLIQLIYWNRRVTDDETKRIGARLISFQILWLLSTLLTFVLIHVISFLVSGQSVVGHFPYRLTAYLTLLIFNVIVITRTAIQLNSSQHKILNRVPSLV